jgi:hypothetical protein
MRMRFFRPGSSASRSLPRDDGSMERKVEPFVEAGSWIGAEAVAADACAPAEATEDVSGARTQQRRLASSWSDSA